MKKIIISKYEWEILALAVISVFPQHFYLHLACRQIVWLYLIAMAFELLTEDAWNYNHVLYKSTFTLRDRDVNLIFGVGWIGALIIGYSAGKWLSATLGWSRLLGTCIAMGIIGNILEEIYLSLGLWKYNLKSWIVTIWTGKPIMIGRIPLSVRVGYFVIMGMIVPWIIGLFR